MISQHWQDFLLRPVSSAFLAPILIKTRSSYCIIAYGKVHNLFTGTE